MMLPTSKRIHDWLWLLSEARENPNVDPMVAGDLESYLKYLLIEGHGEGR